MALEAAAYHHEQDLFINCHNNNNNGNFNKENNNLYPLLLEAYSTNYSNYINTNDNSFFPFLKLQDQFHQNYPSTTTTTNNNFPCDFDNYSSYFHYDNNTQEVDNFDWQSYYYHGISTTNNNVISSSHDDIVIPPPPPPPPTSLIVNDLPPLNNYDHQQQECCWGLVNNNSSSSPSDQEMKAMMNEEDGGVPVEVVVRPKQRRRARAKKNEEEIENQRMTHIAVERNRRKQMNEYLNVLRSLMPESYVQRGDQASIVGAAINFVKELEHNVQNLSAKKQMKENLNLKTKPTTSTSTTTTSSNSNSSSSSSSSSSTSSLPFGEFFTFPQFSTSGGGDHNDEQMIMNSDDLSPSQLDHAGVQAGGGTTAADVEVTMVECHAHLKIRLRRPPKQLSKLVSGLHSLRLSVLHLNVNTADDGVVLYSFSLKVEDESKLSTVDDIAKAVYLLLGRIQDQETN